jgi:hypothetical protein
MSVLKVTIKEELILNGADLGTENVFTDSSITFSDRRVMALDTSTRTVILFNTQPSAGTYADGSVEYMRITNIDDTNSIVLDIRGNSEQYFVDLEPKCSFLLSNNVMDANDEASPQLFSTSNIDSISAKAKAGTPKIEYFIAG